MGERRRSQPLLIRITHWVNVPALAVMIASGLEIFAAHPYFGPIGEAYAWVPLQGVSWPGAMRAGGWLAGARQLHLAVGWVLVLNALVYMAYLLVTGEWRRRLTWAALPPGGLYGRLARVAYTAVLGLAAAAVISGLAIWKPVQLHWLGVPLGGYDGARVVHYLATLGLIAFVAGHLVAVAVMTARNWRAALGIVTGGVKEEP